MDMSIDGIDALAGVYFLIICITVLTIVLNIVSW